MLNELFKNTDDENIIFELICICSNNYYIGLFTNIFST